MTEGAPRPATGSRPGTSGKEATKGGGTLTQTVGTADSLPGQLPGTSGGKDSEGESDGTAPGRGGSGLDGNGRRGGGEGVADPKPNQGGVAPPSMSSFAGDNEIFLFRGEAP